MRLLQYSYPRSGSTIIWHILDHLFSPINTENIDRFFNPANVKKSHAWNDLSNYIQNSSQYDYAFISLREPVGTCLSLLRTGMLGQAPKFQPQASVTHQSEEVNDKNISVKLENYIQHYSWLLNLLDNAKKDLTPFVIFDYHTHVLKIEKVLDIISSALDFPLENKQELVEKFSRKNIKKNITLSSFKEQDNVTLMHGQHIKDLKYNNLNKTLVMTNELYPEAMRIYLQLKKIK